MKRAFTLIELLIVLAIICLILGLLFGGVSGCSKSDGLRKGTLTKFSHKGLIWNSWEGELVMGGLRSGANGGSSANVWAFSIRRDNPNEATLVETLQKALEQDRPVTIRYHQRWVTAPWQADTDYDVVSVTVITNR